MPALQTLDELEQYLRMVMPQWKAVQQFKKNPQSGFIDFKWNGHHFAVKPTLESFEIKDNRLFLTGGSLLLQSALVSRTGNEAKIVAIVDTLNKAEDVIISRPEEGLSLVAAVKKTLAAMAQSSASKR
jgi:hypothetical protein